MQIVVFHCFAYTCCTASFQPFCGMSTIRYNVLNDRAFPHGCYRTLAEYKGSGFLGISVVYGGVFLICLEKCTDTGDFHLIKCNMWYLFAVKSVIMLDYLLEKMYFCVWKNKFILCLKEK